jgi:hypothetical protein
MYCQGRGSNWRRGAGGEYLVAKRLYKDLIDPVVILNDRHLPGTPGNIDHLVVASSGVWVIDTKYWNGEIAYKHVGGIFSDRWKLTVDGVDRTSLTDEIYSQVIPVSKVLRDPGIAIHPALVFANGDWGNAATIRLLRNRPYRHLGVWITWPGALTRIINEDGPMTGEMVTGVGSILDRELPPR